MNATQSEFNSLTSRIERLEVQNRRWRLMNALLLLSGVSVFLMGAKLADRIEPPVVRAGTVEAQEFILKDKDGQVYARLSLGRAFATKRPNGLYSMPNQPNGLYFMPNMVAPAQATLQFYDEKGDVLWTAPSSPTMIPVR